MAEQLSTKDVLGLVQSCCRELSVGDPADSALCAVECVADELEASLPQMANALRALVRALEKLKGSDMADEQTEVFFVMSVLVPAGTDEAIVRENLRRLPIGNPFRILPQVEADAWRVKERVDPVAHYKALMCCRQLFRLLGRADGANLQEMAHADELLGELADGLWQTLTGEERAMVAPEAEQAQDADAEAEPA